jgi:hypothetical protein
VSYSPSDAIRQEIGQRVGCRIYVTAALGFGENRPAMNMNEREEEELLRSEQQSLIDRLAMMSEHDPLRPELRERLLHVIHQLRQTFSSRVINRCSGPDCTEMSVATLGRSQWCLRHLPREKA